MAGSECLKNHNGFFSKKKAGRCFLAVGQALEKKSQESKCTRRESVKEKVNSSQTSAVKLLLERAWFESVDGGKSHGTAMKGGKNRLTCPGCRKPSCAQGRLL